MIWNNIDVSVWGPIITLHPKRAFTAQFYSGYDLLTSWDDFMPNIPLDIRYQDFCQRLDAAKLRRAA